MATSTASSYVLPRMDPSQLTRRGRALIAEPGQVLLMRAHQGSCPAPSVIHITPASASHPEQEPYVRHVHTSAHTPAPGPRRP